MWCLSVNQSFEIRTVDRFSPLNQNRFLLSAGLFISSQGEVGARRAMSFRAENERRASIGQVDDGLLSVRHTLRWN